MLTSKNISTLWKVPRLQFSLPHCSRESFQSLPGWRSTVKSPRSLHPEAAGPPGSRVTHADSPVLAASGAFVLPRGKSLGQGSAQAFWALAPRLCPRLCYLLASAVEAIVASGPTRGPAEAWGGPDPERRGPAKAPGLAIVADPFHG